MSERHTRSLKEHRRKCSKCGDYYLATFGLYSHRPSCRIHQWSEGRCTVCDLHQWPEPGRNCYHIAHKGNDYCTIL